MTKLITQINFIVLGLFLSSLTFAREYKNGDVWFRTGMFAFRTNPHFEKVAVDNMSFSPGLIAFGQFLPKQFLQIGVYTDFEKYRALQDSESIIEGSNRLSFSTGYRYSVTQSFALSMSLVSSYSMGNTNTIKGNRNIAETTASSAASHGAEASLQWLPLRLANARPCLEVMYSHFLTENSNEEADHLGLFVSFVFLFQEGLTPQQRERLNESQEIN